MGTVTLKIKDQKKWDHFKAFIGDLDFVEIIQEHLPNQKSKNSKEKDFLNIVGIWTDNDITAEELRSKAWAIQPDKSVGLSS